MGENAPSAALLCSLVLCFSSRIHPILAYSSSHSYFANQILEQTRRPLSGHITTSESMRANHCKSSPARLPFEGQARIASVAAGPQAASYRDAVLPGRDARRAPARSIAGSGVGGRLAPRAATSLAPGGRRARGDHSSRRFQVRARRGSGSGGSRPGGACVRRRGVTVGPAGTAGGGRGPNPRAGLQVCPATRRCDSAPTGGRAAACGPGPRKPAQARRTPRAAPRSRRGCRRLGSTAAGVQQSAAPASPGASPRGPANLGPTKWVLGRVGTGGAPPAGPGRGALSCDRRWPPRPAGGPEALAICFVGPQAGGRSVGLGLPSWTESDGLGVQGCQGRGSRVSDLLASESPTGSRAAENQSGSPTRWAAHFNLQDSDRAMISPWLSESQA